MSHSGALQAPGRKNEDHAVSGFVILRRDESQVVLHMVIDGHGGRQTADFLLDALPSTIAALCFERSKKLDLQFKEKSEWTKLLQDAFAFCNTKWDEMATTPAEKKAGAVVTVLLVSDACCLVAHVGDGKVLASCGDDFEEHTIDHRACLPEEKQRIESAGFSVVDNRVRGVLAPSRAFGDIYVRTDNSGKLNNVVLFPKPEISIFEVDRPGFVVLGTDGLFDAVSNDKVFRTMQHFQENFDTIGASKSLVDQALAETDDDISVIVLYWTQSPLD